MNAFIEKTTKKEQKMASGSLKMLEKSEGEIAGQKRKEVRIEIQESGEVVAIPLKAFQLLKTIIQNMAEGKSIALIPSDSEVTTQQAAEILNVSRPHVVKLLESGQIPFKKVGTHRRISLMDLLSYEEELKEKRKKSLKFLTKEAQNLNLGYE